MTVLSKGIACGAAAGLCCRWLHPRYPTILLSALAAPLVNTGGGSAGLPTVFHAPHPSVGAAGGLCQRRSLSDGGHGGLSLHTLVFTGGLGRFVALLRRREVTYDEDLLLRGLWKIYIRHHPTADAP